MITIEYIQELFKLTDHEARTVEAFREKVMYEWGERGLRDLEKRLGNDTTPLIEACVYEALRTGSIVDRLGALTREPPELWRELFGDGGA